MVGGGSFVFFPLFFGLFLIKGTEKKENRCLKGSFVIEVPPRIGQRCVFPGYEVVSLCLFY